MPRQQVQLPGVVPLQPAARATDQFHNPSTPPPIPQEIIDLSKFSSSLANVVLQARADAGARARAQGQADAAIGRPYGSGVAMTPEAEANRRELKSEVDKGNLLVTEDPWYRVGVLEGDARRVMLQAATEMERAEFYLPLITPYNKDGNFDPNTPDFDAAIDAVFQKFANAPALQSHYGQQIAADMMNSIRGNVGQALAKARDGEVQKYQQTQVVDQLVIGLQHVADAAADPSIEGIKKFAEAYKGFDDLRIEITNKRNLPDPHAALRQAADAYVTHAALTGSADGLRAIDLVRSLKLGTTTLEGSNTPDNLRFLAQLEDDESRFLDGIDQEKVREEASIKLERTKVIREAELHISEVFSKELAAGKSAVSIARQLETWAASDPRYRDEFKGMIREFLKAEMAPIEDDPEVRQEMYKLLIDGKSAEVDSFLDACRCRSGPTTR